MKTFTYMAALENGVYDGSETYRSGVYVTADGTEIGDWDRNGWGTITFDKGYALSSNVGIINLIHRHMNAKMIREYFKKLGFGKKTGIELPGELPGYLGFRYETEIFNAGFGQGITTTPIQNAQALTPLTNDGILLKPYIIQKIVDPSTGEIDLENKRNEQERVATTQTVTKMLQLMDDCVNGQGNTGSGFRLDNGELIGKTGTAQIAREKGGGYLTGKSDVISSFAGIYPKSDPKIIIYASVKKPSGGSQKPLSNAVKEIVNNMANFYTTTTEPAPVTSQVVKYKVPNFTNKKLDVVTTTLQSNGIKYVVIGNGNKVIKQTPSAKETITTTDSIYLITNDNKLTIPNVSGLSSKIAKNLLQQLNVKVNLDGVGYVTEQSLPQGTEITEGMEITLKLSPKYTG
jgi:penicillin-binding protein 2B